MISWRLNRLTEPQVLPVTLEEAKGHLRVDHSDDDGLIETIIEAAAGQINGPYGAGLVLSPQDWELSLDGFPCLIELPLWPVSAIKSIQYTDQAGDIQTLDPSVYVSDLSSNPARIARDYNKQWPLVRSVLANVRIEFTAGFDTVPADLKQALLLLIGHWYENRDAAIIGTIATDTPFAFNAIVDRYRVGAFG